MKKLLTILIVPLFLLPSVSLAATQSELEAQYHSVLIQLIDLLMTKVKALQTELAALPVETTQTAPSATSTPNTPPAPVFGATAPSDVTSPQVIQVSLQAKPKRAEPPVDNGAPAGVYLAFTSNEAIDLAKTVLPSGVTLGTVTYQGISKNTFGNTKNLAYYYEVQVLDAKGEFDVTVQDLAGNKVTKSVSI